MSLGQIGVVGPGVVGAPMAALLARAAAAGAFGPDARVTVVQRNSQTSGWKVAAINAGRSPIGGIEPGLDEIVATARATGHIEATHDLAALSNADVILVCVQTDKKGMGPDYGPLFGALDGLASALRDRTKEMPVTVVLESTLAPSSSQTVVRERFEKAGVGHQVRLGHSPNRVMPGRLVERIAAADKLVGGTNPGIAEQIATMYGSIVIEGTIHRTTLATAEVVKTLENTWRDVRIAYATEVMRACDAADIDFFALREAVNFELGRADAASFDGSAVPSGAMLVPLIGVGGHCLPKDGILLRWRFDESQARTDRSLIYAARAINDAAPAYALARAEAIHGSASGPGRRVALLGVAYRADSDDCRNSPTLSLAETLRARGDHVVLHDPYVRPEDAHVARAGFAEALVQDLGDLGPIDLAIVCQAHAPYRAQLKLDAPIFDAANWRGVETGLGRGTLAPAQSWIDAAIAGQRAVSTGFSNELVAVIDALKERFPDTEVEFETVRTLAATCATGCDLAPSGEVKPVDWPVGLGSVLVTCALVGPS